MDVAYVSALSALAGSIVGGFTSGITTWMNQRAQARAEQLSRDYTRRQDLYRDFIIAASKAYGEALVSNELRVEELVALYAMVSRMRILGSARTVERAEAIMLATTEAYSAPNKTAQELHDMIKNGKGIDPLRDFAEAVRAELRTSPPAF